MSELYDTLMFGARRLNRDEQRNLILGCVPDDKKMAVLEALGYKMTILNPDKEDVSEEQLGGEE